MFLLGAVLACGGDGASPTATQPVAPPSSLTPTGTTIPATATATASVTGTVSHRERIALTPDAVIEIKLVGISRADAPAITVGEQVIQNPGQVPIAFEIGYNADDIDERFTYAVQARIMEGDRLAFINDTAYHVITRGSPTNVDLVLVVVEQDVAVFRLISCAITRAAELPIVFEYTGSVPTGFDGINQANCTFTQPVETVTVTLTGPATHTEIFTIDPPAARVSFPLPQGTLSATTLEIVPPGEYRREMTVTSVGEEVLALSDLVRVLETVTIIGPPTGPTTEFEFNFDDDDQGWIAGFADLPADFDEAGYELDSGFRRLPSGLDGSGVFVQGNDHSDDLFMLLKKQVGGLLPSTAYAVTVSLDLAVNVPSGLVGIGGAPGESVFVKAGASSVEPIVDEDDSGQLRINIDKGNQATDGQDMIVLGDVAHPEVVGEEYRIKALDNSAQPLEVTTDAEGRIWLIVGTDSGFEGLTALYYAGIDFTLTTQ